MSIAWVAIAHGDARLREETRTIEVNDAGSSCSYHVSYYPEGCKYVLVGGVSDQGFYTTSGSSFLDCGEQAKPCGEIFVCACHKVDGGRREHVK